MKRILTSLCFAWTLCVANAQNVTKAEYFFDENDLGFGLCTPVALTPSTDSTWDISGNISLAGLSAGGHYLYLRVSDDSSSWSHTIRRYVEVAPPVTALEVISGEWFINDDLGYGANNLFTVSPSDTDIVKTLNIPASAFASLPYGSYKVYVRTKDAAGNWSHTTRRNVEWMTDDQALLVYQVEVFDPSDNGFGQNTIIPLTPAAEDNCWTLEIPYNHSVWSSSDTSFIRVRDSVHHQWSHTVRISNAGTPCAPEPPLAAFSLQTQAICAGECISLTNNSTGTVDNQQWTVAGGNPGTSTLPAFQSCFANPGSYDIILVVSNSGGADTVMHSVTVLPNPVAAIGASQDVICEGTGIILTATGGPSVSWSNGLGSDTTLNLTPASTTAYSVTVTDDNNCSDVATRLITVNTNPQVTIALSEDSVCEGESVSLLADGASTYQWNNGLGTNPAVSVVPVSTTTYSVTGTDANNCTGYAETVVAVISLPDTPDIIVSADTLISTVTGHTYQWYIDASPISGATGQKFVATESGSYSVVVYNESGCASAVSDPFVITSTSQIPQFSGMEIYPNPVTDRVNVTGLNANGASYQITDMIGREIIRGNIDENGIIDVNFLSGGVYLLNITGNGIEAIRKFEKL